MSWRDELRVASFRGVEFFIQTSEITTGRRKQLHEFPKRDLPYTEDLGLASKIRHITGYVSGDEYHTKRDSLLNALEQEGFGQLIHPIYGIVNVEVGAVSVSESTDERAIARFDMQFYPYYPLEFPSVSVNTSSQLAATKKQLADSSMTGFSSVITSIKAGLVNVRAFTQGISNAYSVLESDFAPIVAEIGNVSDLAYDILFTPQKIIASIQSYIDELGANTSLFEQYNFNYSLSLASLNGYTRASSSLYNKSVASGTETETITNAVNAVVNDLLIISAGEGVASLAVNEFIQSYDSTADVEQQVISPIERPDVPVTDDIIDTRNNISDMIWDACLKTEAAHYVILNQYRQQIAQHLNAVAASGVRLQRITPLTMSSSLTLAYHRFGDATRHLEIEQRNNIKHRSFIAPNLLQVASND